MLKKHAAILFGVCVAAAACSDSSPAPSVAPSDAAPSFDLGALADALSLRALDLTTLGEVGSEQAATGGRASGHADIPTFAGAFRDHYSFIALSIAPSPTANAKGEFEGGFVNTTRTLVVRFHGDVDCLTIMENQAWVSGPLEKIVVNGQSVPPNNDQFLIRVRDNGEGANDPPDEASFIAEPGPTPQTCRLRPELTLSQNERGNIQVKQE
jgi:hypothetical protein